MPRRRATPTEEQEALQPLAEIPDMGQEPEDPVPAPFSLTQDHPKAKARLSVPLTESGAIDFESIRAGNREKVVAALTHPDTLAVVSSGAGAQPPAVAVSFSESFIDGLLDTESALKVATARALLKAPADLASACMTYTPAQKERLNKPLGKYLSSVAPALIVRHQDLLEILVVWGTITQQQMGALKTAIAERAEAQRPRAARQQAEGEAA